MAKRSRVKIVRTGSNYDSFITAFENQVRLQQNELTVEAARWLRDHVKDVIRQQGFNWVPLDERYAKRKEREGLDDRIYIATGELLSQIKVWSDRQGNIHVGPVPDDIHGPSGLTYLRLLRILEFGTATIPPRPLWRPALANLLRADKKFEQLYRDAVVSKTVPRVRKASAKRNTL